MSEKHTPGPWRANFNVRHEFWVVESLTDDAEICQDRGWGGEYAEQDIANAHLISAAPDLLGNLIGCMEALASHAPDCIEVECARKAIAKARGEPC